MNEENITYYQQDKNDVSSNETQSVNDLAVISWQDLEFPLHNKSITWYLELILVAFVISGLLYFLTKDVITIIVILIGLITLVLYGLKKPKIINFAVSSQNFKIGNHTYQLALFKSYSIREVDLYHSSLSFLPIKRFSPSVILYVKHEKIPEITKMLATIIPLEDTKMSIIDYIIEWFGI